MGCTPLPKEFDTVSAPPPEILAHDNLITSAQLLAQDFATVASADTDPRFSDLQGKVEHLIGDQGPLAAYHLLTEAAMHLGHLQGLGDPSAHF